MRHLDFTVLGFAEQKRGQPLVKADEDHLLHGSRDLAEAARGQLVDLCFEVDIVLHDVAKSIGQYLDYLAVGERFDEYVEADVRQHARGGQDADIACFEAVQRDVAPFFRERVDAQRALLDDQEAGAAHGAAVHGAFGGQDGQLGRADDHLLLAEA